MTTNKQNFLDSEAMLVGLKIGKWSGRKSDSAVAAEIAAMKRANRDVVSVGKKIIPTRALAKITKLSNTARKFYKFHTVSWDDSGKRLLSVGQYDFFRKTMDEFSIEFEDLKIEFVKDYAYWKQQAEKGMGDLYCENDYPSKDEVDRMTFFEWEVIPVPTSNNLVIRLGNKQIEDIKAKMEKENNKRLKKVSEDLYSRISEAINLAREKLTVGDDGKATIIRQSVIDGLANIAEVVPELNIMGDDHLSKLCSDIRDMVSGINATELRPHEENFDESKREKLNRELQEMSEKMGLPI